MNHETDDFARWTRAPRQSVDRASWSGIEHYTPEHEWRGWHWVRVVITHAGAVLIGAMMAGWGAR